MTNQKHIQQLQASVEDDNVLRKSLCSSTAMRNMIFSQAN